MTTTTIRQQLQTVRPAESLAPSPSPRDVQRDALRDLVALASDCAATEARIEQQYRSSTESATKELEKSRFNTTGRFVELVETAKLKHQQRLAEIQAQHVTQVAETKEGHQQARRKIDREFDPVERKTKQQLDHAIWLADSVLEVAQNQIREENKKIREAVKAHIEELHGIELEALKLLAHWNQDVPDEEPADEVAMPEGEDLTPEMLAQRENAQHWLAKLQGLILPGIFVGSFPWMTLIFLCIVAGVVGQLSRGLTVLRLDAIGIAAGGMLVVAVALGLVLRAMARMQVRDTFVPLRASVALARDLADEHSRRNAKRLEARNAEANHSRDAEVHRLQQKATPVFKGLTQRRADAVEAAASVFGQNMAAVDNLRDSLTTQANDAAAGELGSLRKAEAAELAAAQQKFDNETKGSRRIYDEARISLERRLRDGLANIQHPTGDGAVGNGQVVHPWADAYWQTWQPPKSFPALVRFGDLHVDLRQIANNSKQSGQVRLELPDAFDVAAPLAFPYGGSLLIQHDRTGRDQALKLLQSVITRLFTSLPPGRARFTILDPVGLGQSFAGFMRLADHDEALVGTRIWTETDQIEQRLADMTEHMETVIQKYLRNEYATIDQYNAQAGELAEPYRFLVIADFPTAFQGDAFRRLASIVTTGARCGVYVLMARDLRTPLPGEAQLDDIEHHSVNLIQKGDQFVWKDDVFGQFPLALDAPPPESTLTALLDKVGRGARESKRVEVSFDTIAPSPSEFWTGSTTDELQVPIGRSGATRLQMLRLGRGVAQHVLIAGKTGSGKSTLLHALVSNLAMWYSPDQIELYLIDFKKGVEFKTYATMNLPHARAIAVESDREFGVSVLIRLDAELARRGELFRKAGVQDLGAYRRSGNPEIMPRTLLIIDEFQEFFSEDDKLAQDAGLLLDRLVRQGRAFGIHVLLGSQTIGGTSGLARSTIGQMAVRVALQTSEADSQLILGDNNSAARLLSRPGEAIYNDAGGLVEANSPFQVAWLPDEKREKYLEAVSKLADAHGSRLHHDAAIVFEGNAAADIRKNALLAAKLQLPKWGPPPATAYAWVGEPVAIKDPTALVFRRQSGANVMLVGQQEEQAMAVMLSALTSLAVQYQPGDAIFYILDGTPADSTLAGSFEKLAAALPHTVKNVEFRAVGEAFNELTDELQRRQTSDPAGEADVFFFIYGMQRYRVLRKAEEEFSFSSGDEPKAASPGKQLADLLREGPSLGIHVITWIDTVASLDRTLDRTAAREFDNRVLFQMSANDSSHLIDSPAANKLGVFRALSYSEEQGVMEKFRPYSLPDAEWIQTVATALGRKTK
jgi:ABC-type multidrug transport system fused ATPase/permease subunit